MHLSLTHPRRRVRSGNVTLYFLVFMGLTVPTMFWTINIWRIAEGKISQQRVCDACALAAVGMLTEEFTDTTDPMNPFDYSILLYGAPDEIEELCQTHATQEAKNYAGVPTPSTLFSNYVDGAPLDFEIANDNDEDDIQYGNYDHGAATPTFTPINPATATKEARRTINAVRVIGIRSIERGNSIPLFGPAWTGYTDAQIVTRATAVLDRRVIGFRLHKKQSGTGTLAHQKIPLAPIALLNDASATSWKSAVEGPADMTANKIAYGKMTVIIPTASYTAGPAPALNSKLLNIGIADYDDLARQLTEGINGDDVTAYGDDLILDDATYTLPVPPFAAPVGSTTAGTDFDKLYQAFLALQADGTERAWPLTSALPAMGDVTVTGFVAARITDVQILQHAGSAPTNYIQLTLQPTLMNTPTALTDYSGRFLKTTTPANPYDGYSRLVNPYIGRIRLVE